MIFSERLKALMDELNISQGKLCDLTGIGASSVSQYLSGKNTPGPERVKVLADATGVSFDYLMGYEAPTAKEQKVSVKKITTADAARCLGKSKQFVRIGLQRGLLPFGNAVPGVGGSYNYYINPAKFREYVGAEQFDAFFGLTA